VAVGAGEPLFDIYSPDVYAAEMNYIVALRAEGSAGGPLTGAALERLRLLDVPAAAIADIARTGKAPRTIAVPAPAAGVVVAKSAVEGAMARPGEVLFRVADLSTVWVEARVYESDLADVAAGAAAEVRAPFGGGTDYRATVREILPEVEADTRTAGARLVLDNPGGRLRPGMYVEVLIPVSLSKDAVQIPESAVLRSGERDTVFVARDDGAFEPRDVTLGGRTGDGRYVVTRGLSGGERVVISGQFLLDAESRYQEAVQKMLSAPH
jgi:RND family efflux transporter MFP subunit